MEFVSEFGSVLDHYAIKAGVFPERVPTKQSPMPMLVTDDGLQMAARFAADRSGYEIYTRKSLEEEWVTTNNKIPANDSFREIRLRAAGDILTFMIGPEVYAAGN